MIDCETLIRNTRVFDGGFGVPNLLDVALRDGRICAIGSSLPHTAYRAVEG
jgi:N-acyl-D-aspartate/D-glutamate deacylase